LQKNKIAGIARCQSHAQQRLYFSNKHAISSEWTQGGKSPCPRSGIAPIWGAARPIAGDRAVTERCASLAAHSPKTANAARITLLRLSIMVGDTELESVTSTVSG
jgi:hypothetical protein